MSFRLTEPQLCGSRRSEPLNRPSGESWSASALATSADAALAHPLGASQVREARQLARLGQLARERTGVEFPGHKLPMIAARLLPRLRELGLGSFAEYLDRLDDAEAEVLVDRLTTHETSFFRDPEQLRSLAALLRERFATAPRVRAWSAACSTGEEAWTVGMLLSTCCQDSPRTQLSVVGTDISLGSLKTAARADYELARAREIPLPYLKRFMLRGTGDNRERMRVAAELRSRTEFYRESLLADSLGLGPFELVLLRNVLMYFARETRRTALTTVLKRVAPRGLLVVGRVDSLAVPGLIALGNGIFELEGAGE